MPGQSQFSLSLVKIKRRARDMHKAFGLKLAVALDRAAVEFGFQNYRQAHNSCATDSDFKHIQPEFPITITQYWSDGDTGLRGNETLKIDLSRPINAIASLNRLRMVRGLHGLMPMRDSHFQMELVTPSQEQAQEHLYVAARALAFMDVTRLLPSSGYSRAYPARQPSIPGQDHASVWFDPLTRRYLITDEPYKGRREEKMAARLVWLEQFGYVMQKPTWIGMHNPYNTAEDGTRLYLVAHATKGAELQPIIKALNSLPPAAGKGPWCGVSAPTAPVHARRSHAAMRA